MKKSKLLGWVFLTCAITVFPAYAGEWKQDEKGWQYQNEDGSCVANQWQEIDGRQYYFGSDGYRLENTTTPDGKRVGTDGALILTASVSQIDYTADSVTRDLVSSDWMYTFYGTTYHRFEVTNYSPYTISLDINESAKNGAGQIVGAGSASEDDIPSGCTIFLINYISDTTDVTGFETTFQTTINDYYIPVLQNIAVETVLGNKKVIVKIINNGSIAAEFPQATAVFFKNGKVVDCNNSYLTDADYEIKPGAVITKEIKSYEDFDDVKVHLTAQKYQFSS